MIECGSPEALAATVRLLRDAHAGSILLVEGGADAKCYRAFTVEGQCELLCAGSRDVLIRALEILQGASVEGVLGIVDADFSLIDNDMPGLRSLFHTDSHDLETMVVASPALERVLAELGSAAKLEAHARLAHQTHREAVIAAALPIGHLRHLSRSADLGLRFEGLRFSTFILNKPCLSCDTNRLVSEVKNHSQRHDLNSAAIVSELSARTASGHDPWQICCGHDLANILAVALRRVFGTNPAATVSPERVEQSLRLAFEFAYFRETQLYSAVWEWQRSTGQPVFRS